MVKNKNSNCNDKFKMVGGNVMIIAYENDTLKIPRKYKKMSVSELENEETKMLNELLKADRKKKIVKNTSNIIFNLK